MILMPAMGAAQQAAWHSLLELYELQPDGECDQLASLFLTTRSQGGF